MEIKLVPLIRLNGQIIKQVNAFCLSNLVIDDAIGEVGASSNSVLSPEGYATTAPWLNVNPLV